MSSEPQTTHKSVNSTGRSSRTKQEVEGNRLVNGKVQCLECGKIIESKYRHDFRSCGCPQDTCVDGGHAYTRILGKDLDKIKVLQEADGSSYL